MRTLTVELRDLQKARRKGQELLKEGRCTADECIMVQAARRDWKEKASVGWTVINAGRGRRYMTTDSLFSGIVKMFDHGKQDADIAKLLPITFQMARVG